MSAPCIDSHQHFWRLERGDYAWLEPSLEPLHRDFEPADLEPVLRELGIDATIVVQAAPSVAETRFLLELAERTPWIAGVVGWVDLASPHAPRVLDELQRSAAFRGVRPMIQDIPDPDWMLRRDLEAALRELARRDLRFDALVRPQHLSRLLRLLDRHPELRVVVDHAAKPPIAAGTNEPWAADLARLASATGACCKLSGLVTEASADWSTPDLVPYVEHVLACFGPGRVLWGSDWPVCELAGGYRPWWSATRELLAPLDADARSAVLGGNAAAFYGIALREEEGDP